MMPSPRLVRRLLLHLALVMSRSRSHMTEVIRRPSRPKRWYPRKSRSAIFWNHGQDEYVSAKRLPALGRSITSRVCAFVPEHCGKRAWASLRFDADFGSGQGIADRRTAGATPLAVTLPWAPERTAIRPRAERSCVDEGESAMMGGVQDRRSEREHYQEIIRRAKRVRERAAASLRWSRARDLGKQAAAAKPGRRFQQKD